MKKFINDPGNLTRELLEGFAIAHRDIVTVTNDKIVCRAQPKPPGKVALVTLGGAGHEPALSGFVGEGALDFSVVGDIFAAPGPPKVLEALRMAKRDAGILFIVLNHAGDVMSANMAAEMADKEGIRYKMLLTHEDIAPGADAPAEDKRGMIGCCPLYKIAGAAAEAGKSLDEVHAIASRFNDEIVSGLLDGATECLLRHGAPEDAVSVFRVPGAFEIPTLAAKLARSGSFDALVTLGCLLRGDTPHFDFISAQVTSDLSRVASTAAFPITFGVITCNTREQAIERSSKGTGNKGWEAALAAIEMANLWRLVDGEDDF